MAQTHEGAMKIAAGRAGVPLTEYLMRRDAGEKWCYACRIWRERTEFRADQSRYDGQSSICAACRNARSRERYRPKDRPATSGPAPLPPREGDKHQARRHVNQDVLWGRIPRANDLPCVDCGHQWREGGIRHEYDHYLGYAAEHHKDVQAVCSPCHHARELRRAGRIA